MMVIRKLCRHYCRIWESAPSRLIVVLLALFLAAYGTSMLLRPEQLQVLVAYQVLQRYVCPTTWGAVAYALALMMAVWPLLPHRLRLVATFASALYWWVIATMILIADGINSGVTNYYTLALLSGVVFVRYDREVE